MMRVECRAILVLRWAFVGLALLPIAAPAAAECNRKIQARVVALDQVFFWNRLGAVQPQGMMYALEHDVEPITGSTLSAGNVRLKAYKRPRPLVLRMNVGDCLVIHFRNLLDPVRRDNQQVATRDASIHAVGMHLVQTIRDDGSNVGANGAPGNGVIPPGGSITYVLYAEREGEHAFYSSGAMTGGEGDGGQMNAGLFGAIITEPMGSTWYRSQLTWEDLDQGTISATPDGQPIIDYNAVYTLGPRAGLPVFKMLQGSTIVHSDLTAIIAGPFAVDYPPNPVYPKRDQSFREFVIQYHDEIGAVQAFDLFEDPILEHTLHSVRDAFAINYGTGGIGAEILANRFGVGPMLDCTECKYEEFFLSSWTVGDPAMVVDVPANVSNPDEGIRATQAFYPDDPSNVYHSYLRDHVKFRILHGGSKEHHIHHQHTHQWLYAPDSDESSYLDSQALGPGASFTLEMVYNGSGNRNQAVGDSIFHCHFYPHFAQGMWAMWRVHDVFEDGSRMLPDGEILQGTPIPAVVPIPGIAMAPMPGAAVTIAPDPLLPKLGGQVQINGKFVRNVLPLDVPGNPGYPFWVPGIAGHRPPHPPLDTVDDGGLRRHIIVDGETIHVETRLDFTKEIEEAVAFELQETGETVERRAMKFHGVREHASFRPDGTPDTFITNGLPPVAGAPYADPCIDDAGNPVGGPVNEFGNATPVRNYKAADIQLDVIFNKAGWHFPQQRITTLWGDVAATFAGTRAPEPFFFRANSEECIEYQLTNLVPNIYELDDFQVRTPTDILGQHIHLVKFDVTASDGAANGWNYEDGSFSPDEVRERMRAIRTANGCIGDEVTGGDPNDGSFECPIAEPHPYFGSGPNNAFLGAQTTVQRWYADDVLNLAGEDRTLRTVFTHDHFGPSTHQQAGLYAGLVIEPKDSAWRDPQSGVTFGNRFDGGPTSWRADILTANDADSYREFLLEFADFQLAYKEGSHPELPSGGGPVFPLPWNGVARQPGEGFDRPDDAINPPGKKEVGLPFLLERPDQCPVAEDESSQADPNVPPPCPEAVSADDPGTMVVNYRNEPVALRVFDPSTQQQAAGNAGDLALAFSSLFNRADPDFNVQPPFYPPLTQNILPRDPYTPLLQAFEQDKVQVRVLVGAHEEGHNFSINGVKWLFEPSWTNSGFRNSEMMGISEHFEFLIPPLVKSPLQSKMDHLWAAGSASDDLWNGIWGIFRVYRNTAPHLLKLPNNPQGGSLPTPEESDRFIGVCPDDVLTRSYSVVASFAQNILPGGSLIYNPRPGVNGEGPIHDPQAILYVRADDIDPLTGKLKPNVPIEPLILRANAGECIEVELKNELEALSNQPPLLGFNTLPMLVDDFNNNQLRPSNKVGLHPQLVFYDVSRHDGNNVGINQIRTADPGQTVTYQWFAGEVFVKSNGSVKVKSIEFGATNLIPADRIKHPHKGAIGALIIEPEGAVWTEDSDLPNCGQPGEPRCSRAGATIKAGSSAPVEFEPFREFVLLFQDDLNLRCTDCGSDPLDQDAIPNLAESEDPEDSGQKAFNYRTEPMWFRYGFAPDADLEFTRDLILTNILTDGQVGGEPETPLFLADGGMPVRFRVLEPGGHARNHVFQVHGHTWEHECYADNSTRIDNNPLSMHQGAKMGHGPTNHFDAVLRQPAGSAFEVEGDYLFRDQSSFLFDGGLWGIFRVE